MGSLCSGLNYAFAPFAGIITDKFGFRETGISGGVLAFVGILCSAFAPSVQTLWVTFGVILGIGLSLLHNTSATILGYYFKKYHGLASGIYCIGGNVFGVILSQVLWPLLSAIGYKYMMICFSVLGMITIPAAMTWTPVNISDDDHPSSSSSSSSSSHSLPTSINRSRRTVEQSHNNAKDASAAKEDENHGRNLNRSSGCKACLNYISNHLDMTLWRNRNYVLFVFASSIGYTPYVVNLVHLVSTRLHDTRCLFYYTRQIIEITQQWLDQ